MKYIKSKKIALAAAGMILCISLKPMQVSAANENNSVLQTAGIAMLFENKHSTEEYIEIAQQAEGASWGYTNIGITKVVDCNLNVREQPSIDAKLVGKMPENSACEVLEMLEGWAHIKSGEVDGYVCLDYLLTGPEARLKAKELVKTVVVVNVDDLNVRVEPNTDSAILTRVPKGEELEYVETLEGWVKVAIDNEEAYVSSEYVTVEDRLKTAITMTELRYGVGVSDVRVDLVEYAKQFLGNPYVWGGTSLTKGADCSGFVLSIFKKYGYKLPHYSGSQAKCGTKISLSELQPGDLVFYNNDKGVIGHVAIYIGNNQVIHASSPTTGIIISKFNYRTAAKYVRILPD